MYDIIDMDQGSAQWHILRANHIGASDAPVIMGVNKFRVSDGRIKTPHILWQQKLGLIDCTVDNAAMRYGRNMEQPAREAYEMATGTKMTPCVIVSKQYPHMMASLDGLSDNGLAIEIKNCSVEDHEIARQGRVPDHYYPQVMHQMICLGADHMHYYSYHRSEGIIVDVPYDASYAKKLIIMEQEFWAHVRNLTDPPLTDHDYYPMDADWADKARMLDEINESIRVQQQLADEIKAELVSLCAGRNAIGGNYMLSSVTRKGSIDYGNIPELQSINLDQYRRPDTQYWQLRRRR